MLAHLKIKNVKLYYEVMDDNGWGSKWRSRDPGFLSSEDADAGDADGAGDEDIEEKKGTLVSYSNALQCSPVA